MNEEPEQTVPGQRTVAPWDELLKRTRAKGVALGVVTEDDVERMCDEFRAEKLKR